MKIKMKKVIFSVICIALVSVPLYYYDVSDSLYFWDNNTLVSVIMDDNGKYSKDVKETAIDILKSRGDWGALVLTLPPYRIYDQISERTYAAIAEIGDKRAIFYLKKSRDSIDYVLMGGGTMWINIAITQLENPDLKDPFWQIPEGTVTDN